MKQLKKTGRSKPNRVFRQSLSAISVPARSFFELALLADRIGLRMDPWQAGLNYLLLLSACFFLRYTEWQDTRTNKVMARELYDHEKDPHENVNSAAEPEYKQDVERLSQMLKRGWRRGAGVGAALCGPPGY